MLVDLVRKIFKTQKKLNQLAILNILVFFFSPTSHVVLWALSLAKERIIQEAKVQEWNRGCERKLNGANSKLLTGENGTLN